MLAHPLAIVSLAAAVMTATATAEDADVRDPIDGPSQIEASEPDARIVDIYPTGRWPRDVQNVQAAVDAGGTVRLKAVDFTRTPTAFNFGGDSQTIGSVRLHTDVIVVGEEAGSARTTIRGGTIPFFGTT